MHLVLQTACLLICVSFSVYSTSTYIALSHNYLHTQQHTPKDSKAPKMKDPEERTFPRKP